MSLSDIKKNMPEMKREELIAYDNWLTSNKWGSSVIITPEQAADLYLAEHPLHPAEGAEDILTNLETYYDFKFHWIERDRMIRAMHEFATLHAQKIADKMVSERLRETTERCKKLEFMIDKGLGWKDMENDITMPVTRAESAEADKIRAKYLREINKRREIEQSTQN